MAEIEITSFEQIATILAQLATNYTNLFVDYETLFYSNVPQDVTIQIYNAEGILETFTIPNRAKDRQFILNGKGNPDGVVPAGRGAIYQDLEDGKLYLKQVGTGNIGWYKLISDAEIREVVQQGEGSPEGQVTAPKGTVYVDRSASALYIKTSSIGNTGWTLVSADTTRLATIDLDNLSNIGNNKFANPNLTNLSEEGRRKIEGKESLENKKTTISASSTNTDYPSAKAVYDLVYENTKDGANKSLDNLNEAGEEHFLGKNRVKDCILSASNGVASYEIGGSNNYIEIKSGIKLLMANGKNANYQNINEEYITNTTVRINISNFTSKSGVCFLYLDNGLKSLYCDTDNYVVDGSTPSASDNSVSYNPQTNTYKYKLASSSNWIENKPMVEIAFFSTDGSGKINYLHANNPIVVATYDNLINAEKEILSTVDIKLDSKLDPSDKKEIVAWGMPDYTAGMSAPNGFTAPKDGWVRTDMYFHTEDNRVFINDIAVAGNRMTWRGDYSDWRICDFIPIPQGAKLTYRNESGNNATFYPCKGVR